MKNTLENKVPLNRLKSGVPRLDSLLGGGFFEGGLYLFQASPGLGKTVLANQLCHAQAANGGNAVYMTLLAESTNRLTAYLQGLSFVNSDLINDRVHYFSGYNTLKTKGLAGLTDLIKKVLTERKATCFVLDGLDVVQSVSESDLAFREFIHAVQVLGSVAKFTSFLLTPVAAQQENVRSDHAVADGVLELSERQFGPRAIRELQILKLRGSGFLKGRHEVEITNDGLIVHPRTEVQFRSPSASSRGENRIRMAFGIKGLDEMLQQGLLSGSMTTLYGAPGIGKTTLGTSFLAEGAKRGQSGIYFGFYETPERLITKMRTFGVDLETPYREGLVDILWQQSVENCADGLAERLLERIRERKNPETRIFIDGMSGFRRALAYSDRFGSFLAALTNELRAIGATTLFSEEAPIFGTDIDPTHQEMGSVVDNFIFLRYVELRSQIHRMISIMKVRESDYDSSIRQFKLTANGIEVSGSFESAEAVLSGIGRLLERDPS